MTTSRTLTLIVAVLFAVVGCGGDSRTGGDASPTSPAPPPEFWSTVADTPQQQADVARATRQIDVCALLPRDTLDDLGLGEIRGVAIGLNSCRADLGDLPPAEASTLTWHTALLPPLTPNRGIRKQVGDADVLLVADRDTEPHACGATVRFPAGAGFYLGVSTPHRDSCAVADGLLSGMIERWQEAPPQGTSPDTVPTVLLGADPCAVRAELADTADTDERRLNQCLFRYQDDTVTVTYEYRVPDRMRDRATEEEIDHRTVFRTTSLYDPTIPIYSAAVGDELPADDTAFVSRAPAVEVSAATDDVARQVITQVLTLFPQ